MMPKSPARRCQGARCRTLAAIVLFVVMPHDRRGASAVHGSRDAFVQFLLDTEDRGAVQPVEGSPIVQENLEGRLILAERHSDGGALIPGRSTGVFDVEPYVSVHSRRGTEADPRGMRVEWKIGNCDVGPDAAFSVALLDGRPLGTCWSPHCYAHLQAPGVDKGGGGGGTEIEIVLLRAGADGAWETTPFGRTLPLIWDVDGQDVRGLRDMRDTHRQQACLPVPAASKEGELYVVDVVYSLVHRQLVLFGPTHKPLGGLYCVWDGNPQTSTTARKVCHPQRIAEPLQKSWSWARPPDGSWVNNRKGYSDRRVNTSAPLDASEPRTVVFQCVFAATAERGEVVSTATLIEDGQSSHNLAMCFPPEDIRLLIMGQGKDGDNWTGGGFIFRVADERSGDAVAQVKLPLCPYVVSTVPRWAHELSICAIFRDQAPYLAEWMEYHLLAGVQHFYLYNHKSADNATAELAPYVRAGVLDLHQWDLAGHPQKEAFLHCTHKYGHESRWLAMIDVDEFLLAGDGLTQDVKDVVRQFEAEPRDTTGPDTGQQDAALPAVLYVQEMFYGHQGYDAPPSGLVIENYANHSDDISKFAYRKKYIFRPAEGFIYIPCIHDIANGYFEPSLLPADVLRINHYTVKSRRHWAGDHIKRYQPCTDEWNEVRSTGIWDAYGLHVRRALCLRTGRVSCGTHVHFLAPLPADAALANQTCEDAMQLLCKASAPMPRMGLASWHDDVCGKCAQVAAARGDTGGEEGLSNWLSCVGVGEEGLAVVRDGGALADELLDMSVADLATALDTSQLVAEGIVRCADTMRAAATATTGSRSATQDDAELEPAVAILSPIEGETVLRAVVNVTVVGVPHWEECCFIDIMLDAAEPGVLVSVEQVQSRAQLPVLVDRNRRTLPFGPSWHTMLVRLLHRDAADGAPLAEARRRVRFTGPRKIVNATHTRYPRGGEAGGRRFPQVDPVVCCAFLSSGRLPLLRRSLAGLIAHFETHEPSIAYELAWVDNDSGPEALEVYRDFDIERVALFRVNYGATHGFNTLLFDLCRRSPYVMTMEEDWEWIAERSHVPVVDMALRVLRDDDSVLGVLLRHELDYKAVLSDWRTTSDGAVEYRRHCARFQGGMGWGAWTNGAAIWKRHVLAREIGLQDEEWGDGAELDFAQRVGRKFCAAQLRLAPGCETTACNSAARHIGESARGTLERSPGWESHIQGFV